jgi:hypothetical protein
MTTSNVAKPAYIYDQATNTWYPVAGVVNTSADFSWTGDHNYELGSAVSFTDVLTAKGGVNNFQNPSARDSAIPSPSTGTVCFVRQDASGNVINQIQYYYGGAWRWTDDSVSVSAKTANYTLVLADAGKTINMNVSSANTLIIPPNSSVAFPVNTAINIVQTGTGQVTVTAGSGVTINSRNSNIKLGGQYAGATIIKLDTNTWILLGDLTA